MNTFFYNGGLDNYQGFNFNNYGYLCYNVSMTI